MKLKEPGDFSVVQQMEIESDHETGLKAAISLAMVEHRSAKFYRVTDNPDGSNTLTLLWYQDAGAIALPFELDTLDTLFSFASTWWRKAGKLPSRAPDTDGDVERGFRAESGYCGTFMKLTPIYIIYGK